MGLPAFENIYQGGVSIANLRSSTWFSYDGEPRWDQVVGDKGELTAVRRRIEINGQEKLVDTRYGYDQWGNVQLITHTNSYGTYNSYATGDPRVITTTYESAYHVYPVQVTNDLGQMVQYDYDYRLGQVTQETEANGATTAYTYDAFGRLTKVIRPGDTEANPTVMYAYHDDDLEPATPVLRDTWRKAEADAVPWVSGGRWMREFYDGLGRLIQVHTPYQDGEYDVVRFIGYDARGLKVAESAPYLKPAYTYSLNCNGKQCNPYVAPWLNMPQTQYRYDALGRLTQTVHPDGSAVSRVYSGWYTSDIDEKGAWRFSERDAFGRLIRVDETVDTFKDAFDDLDAWETTGDVYLESNDAP